MIKNIECPRCGLLNKVYFDHIETAKCSSCDTDMKRARRGNSLEEIMVSTKDELKSAVESGYKQITVIGELADKLTKAYTIKDKIPLLSNKFQGQKLSASVLAGALTGIEIASF